MAPRKPKPPPKQNFLYMTPGSKVPDKKAATKKVAVTKTTAKAAAKKAAASPGRNFLYMTPGSKTPAKKVAATSRAASLAKGGKDLTSKARGDVVRGNKAKAATARKKAAAAAPSAFEGRVQQASVDKASAFAPTEIDPAGWASIAQALGNAGDPRFAAYKVGRAPSTAAKAYVAKTKPGGKGQARGKAK